MNIQESSDPSRCIDTRLRNDLGGGDELLTPRQVAALFHVNTKTVARWAQAGKIGSTTTVGGHRRYRRTEILALLRDLSEP
ncbi:excisionase family DNA binding protein [Rhodococcus erythropolis]|uniref:BldC family transcriptional regulator n=1 Tax=Rhodococcus erythropolis TaxID=1833 RepID=UPI00216833D5|nr:BldC family transcriptional regulator [Rhodococcus erythropolis]MCS4255905.1 excisionase family DNA binding protein [Rhodococcus erythropolis]MCW2425422.1 excisionase family DNA binding protein [Rhodococcus erythropolis]